MDPQIPLVKEESNTNLVAKSVTEKNYLFTVVYVSIVQSHMKEMHETIKKITFLKLDDIKCKVQIKEYDLPSVLKLDKWTGEGILFVYCSVDGLIELRKNENQIFQKLKSKKRENEMAFVLVYKNLPVLFTRDPNEKTYNVSPRKNFRLDSETMDTLFQGEELSRQWRCPFYILPAFGQAEKLKTFFEGILLNMMSDIFYFQIMLLKRKKRQKRQFVSASEIEESIRAARQRSCSNPPLGQNEKDVNTTDNDKFLSTENVDVVSSSHQKTRSNSMANVPCSTNPRQPFSTNNTELITYTSEPSLHDQMEENAISSCPSQKEKIFEKMQTSSTPPQSPPQQYISGPPALTPTPSLSPSPSPSLPSSNGNSDLTSLPSSEGQLLSSLPDEIDSKKTKYFVVRKLSSKGGSGSTYLVRRWENDQYSDQLFVLKKITFLNSPQRLALALKEASWLLSHNITNVIKGYDTWGETDNENNMTKVFIVMEYAENGDLSNKYPMKEKELQKVANHICQALKELHKQKRVHRDVKIDNIFMTRDGVYKLGDLGTMATAWHFVLHTRVGTEGYKAPEIYSGAGYDAKVDIWALGVCLLQLATNVNLQQKFGDIGFNILTGRLKKEELLAVILPQYSFAFRNLLELMLELHPEDRPTVEQILEHPWITKAHK